MDLSVAVVIDDAGKVDVVDEDATDFLGMWSIFKEREFSAGGLTGPVAFPVLQAFVDAAERILCLRTMVPTREDKSPSSLPFSWKYVM